MLDPKGDPDAEFDDFFIIFLLAWREPNQTGSCYWDLLVKSSRWVWMGTGIWHLETLEIHFAGSVLRGKQLDLGTQNSRFHPPSHTIAKQTCPRKAPENLPFGQSMPQWFIFDLGCVETLGTTRPGVVFRSTQQFWFLGADPFHPLFTAFHPTNYEVNWRCAWAWWNGTCWDTRWAASVKRLNHGVLQIFMV